MCECEGKRVFFALSMPVTGSLGFLLGFYAINKRDLNDPFVTRDVAVSYCALWLMGVLLCFAIVC